MSFFDDLLGGISNDPGGFASSLAGIGFGLFGDQNDLPKDAAHILDTQRHSLDALIDPNDPKFLALAQSLEHDKVSSFAEGIRNYMNLLRRGSLTGMVNPERRDEGISQAFGKARQSAGEEARAQARDYLAQAAGMNMNGNVSALLTQQANQNNATMGAIGAGGDLLSYIFGKQNTSPQTVVNLNSGYNPIKPNVRAGSANAASYSDPVKYYG